jgi:chorismate mutase
MNEESLRSFFWSVDPLGTLTSLALQRILLGDKVAEAKFGTGQPIEDPRREQQVLETVERLATTAGADPFLSVRFFQDQLEANKIVQRGLHDLWTTYPELCPSGPRPDLAREVRPRLDQITAEIIEQLVIATSDGAASGEHIADATDGPAFGTVIRDLDSLHRRALEVALRSLSTGLRHAR